MTERDRHAEKKAALQALRALRALDPDYRTAVIKYAEALNEEASVSEALHRFCGVWHADEADAAASAALWAALLQSSDLEESTGTTVPLSSGVKH